MEKKFEHVEKTYTFLRGYLESKGFENSLKALPFARKAHEGVFRKGGDPYIIHPLSVAQYLINIGLDSDYFIAPSLLHDVPEDVPDITVNDLPVDNEVKRLVDVLSFKKYQFLEKRQALQLYYLALGKEVLV